MGIPKVIDYLENRQHLPTTFSDNLFLQYLLLKLQPCSLKNLGESNNLQNIEGAYTKDI